MNIVRGPITSFYIFLKSDDTLSYLSLDSDKNIIFRNYLIENDDTYRFDNIITFYWSSQESIENFAFYSIFDEIKYYIKTNEEDNRMILKNDSEEFYHLETDYNLSKELFSSVPYRLKVNTTTNIAYSNSSSEVKYGPFFVSSESISITTLETSSEFVSDLYFIPTYAFDRYLNNKELLTEILYYISSPLDYATTSPSLITSQKNLWTTEDLAKQKIWYDYCKGYDGCGNCFSSFTIGGINCYPNPYVAFDINDTLIYPPFISAGPKGEKGEVGPIGVEGKKGEKGEAGPIGITGMSGMDGESFSWTSPGSLAVFSVLMILVLVMIFLLSTHFTPSFIPQLYIASVGGGLIISILLLFIIVIFVSSS
jgi:hypothetical protein